MEDIEKQVKLAYYALEWWQSKRPITYDCKQHYENPTINCTTLSEKNLAKAICSCLEQCGVYE